VAKRYAWPAQVDNGIAAREFQHKPHLVLLNRTYYEKELKPLLAQWVVIWLSLQQSSFQGGVTLKDEQMLRYLLHPTNAVCGYEATPLLLSNLEYIR
jgi:hypothetical protein